MGATVRASIATGVGPTLASAASGIKFNREDTQSGASAPVPVPTTTGTNFAWVKQLLLEVIAPDATSLSNRKVLLSGVASAGLVLWFKDGTATYVQPASDNKPTDSGANGATPAGYTACSTSAQTWDPAIVSAGSAGRNGNFITVVLGVDFRYVGGAGSAITLPELKLQYDEA